MHSTLIILPCFCVDIQIENIKQMYLSIRTDVDTSFSPIYNHAVRMADKLCIEPQHPRNAARQKHRSNAPSGSVRDYYTRNLAIPFLDSIIAELDSRFSGLRLLSCLCAKS